ncbi:MAG: hypothetical protein EOM67_16245, partial [Spirochaetia bacterium]|nr:hypothetical protein [Spirochaetia bacterium]
MNDNINKIQKILQNKVGYQGSSADLMKYLETPENKEKLVKILNTKVGYKGTVDDFNSYVGIQVPKVEGIQTVSAPSVTVGAPEVNVMSPLASNISTTPKVDWAAQEEGSITKPIAGELEREQPVSFEGMTPDPKNDPDYSVTNQSGKFVYTFDKEKSDRRKEKDAFNTILDEQEKRINQMTDSVGANIRRNANNVPTDQFIPAYSGAAIATPQTEYGKAQGELLAAQTILKDAKQASKAPKKGENWAKSFGIGGAETITDPDAWLFGILSLNEVQQSMHVFEKVEKGEPLTATESALMDAMLTRTQAEAMRSSDTSNWYKGGKIAGEALPFMRDMAMTGGLNTITTAVGKGSVKLAQRATAKYLRKKAEKQLLKEGIDITEDILS